MHVGATWCIGLNLRFLQPTQVHNPNGITIGSAVFSHSWPQSVSILGHDPRRSKSGERAEIFFVQVNNARLYRFPVSQISQNLHTRRGCMSPWFLSENIYENLPVRGLFSRKATLCENLHAISDFRPRDFSEMIIKREKSRQVSTPTECWLSIYMVGINSKWFPWPVERAHGVYFRIQDHARFTYLKDLAAEL